MDETISPRPALSVREKTSPFLIRTFLKVGGFHRIQQFIDGPLPTTDETQIFTWKDATLKEVLTTIRDAAPHMPEYRHALAKFSFRAAYADPTSKGAFTTKDLGQVYSRDILGEPGTLTSIAPKLVEDDGAGNELDREREEKTLDELKLIPGDYLLVAVFLPKNVTQPTGVEQPRSATANGPGWKSASARTDNGWGGGLGPSGPPSGRGGGHWRGESNGASTRGRGGRGGFLDRDRDRDRDEDSRVPPPRRGERGHSPPPRGPAAARRGGRFGRGGRRSRSRSRTRSRSPPPRRNSRYD